MWLRLLDNGSAEWVEDGNIRQGTVLDAADAFADSRPDVLVPGHSVWLTHVHIPSRRHADIERALPFALEEWLVEPLDSQHIVWREDEGEVAVAVTAHQAMTGWCAQLEAAGLRPETMLPETLALPWEPASWTLFVVHEAAWLRTGRFAGQTCHLSALPTILKACWESTPELARPSVIRFWCQREDEMTDILPPVELQSVLGDPMTAFQVERESMSLLAGPYATRERLAGQPGTWRRLAVAAGVLLCSVLAQYGVKDHRLAQQAGRLQTRIDRVFHQAVPDEWRIVDARAQLAQALAYLQQDASEPDFLKLLASAADEIASRPGVEIRQLDYRAGRLDLKLTGPNPAAIKTLEMQFRQRGFVVTQGTLEKHGSGVRAHLQLTAGGV